MTTVYSDEYKPLSLSSPSLLPLPLSPLPLPLCPSFPPSLSLPLLLQVTVEWGRPLSLFESVKGSLLLSTPLWGWTSPPKHSLLEMRESSFNYGILQDRRGRSHDCHMTVLAHFCHICQVSQCTDFSLLPSSRCIHYSLRCDQQRHIQECP